ncbi:unnamed protein product, partial [Amoebophrya sp. A120]
VFPWSPEDPQLYLVEICLKEVLITRRGRREEDNFDEKADVDLDLVEVIEEGLVLQEEKLKVGFRTVECGTNLSHPPNVLCVNGRPIVIKGVNRHEFQWQRGRVLSEADMLQDLALLKAGNFN